MRNPRRRKRPLGNSSSRGADARQPKKRRSLNLSTSPLFRCSRFSFYLCTISHASRRKKQGVDEKYTPGCRVSPALKIATTLNMDVLHAIHTSRQPVDQVFLNKHQHSMRRPPQTTVSGRCVVRLFVTRQVLATPASSPSHTSKIVQILTEAT